MRSLWHVSGALATALLACAVVAIPAGAAADSGSLLAPREPETRLIPLGSDPIPFQLRDLEGKTVSLADFQGRKAILLAFWSLFCGPCREEIPLLDGIAKKYAPKGLVMLAINQDGQKFEKQVQAYVSGGGFTFRTLWEKPEEEQPTTADAYGVEGTPSLVLIGKDGKISWTHLGREAGPEIEGEIEKALAQ